MIITSHAYARAGLVGNPSDGYFGKTISTVIRNYRTTVRLWESPHFEIVAGSGDLGRFSSVDEFLRDVKLHGYYGGMRLIKAAVRKFHDHFQKQGKQLHDRNFTIEFHSSIPRLVGLSGSSAIVCATMRCLMQFYGVDIQKEYLPTLILECEKGELGINAGLQDRVIQVYEGIVYMDFDRELVTKRGYGRYEPLQLRELPPLYIAFDPDRAEISDVPHRNLRALWDSGDSTVVAAMQTYRELTDRGREAMLRSDWDEFGKVMDANYDLRRTIMNVAPENHRMVEAARSVGCSAKFAGSGGAIVGLYRDGRQYQKLCDTLGEIRCTVIRPIIYEQ